MLWLCLHFPKLPLEALTSKPSFDEDCLRVVIEANRVITCDDAVEALGVKPGLKQSTVSGLLSGQPLQLISRQTEQEQRALKQLTQWTYSITPTLTLWRDDCLQLEVGRCLLVHGGLENLLKKITTELDRRGFTASVGIGPSQEAAWLFSQSDPSPMMDMPIEGLSLESRLSPLPLAHITDFPKDTAALAKAGVRTFKDLFSLSSTSLKRRCSREFTRWVDQLLCRVETAIEDFYPEPEYSDIIWLGYGSKNHQELALPMKTLLESFAEFVRNTQLETQHIAWAFLPVQGVHTRLNIHSSECHSDLNRWLEQSLLKLDLLTFDDLIEGVQLTACELSAAQHKTQDLFLESKHQEPLSQLIDRLRSRLGFQAVTHVYERSEHLPEHCSYTDPNQFTAQVSNPSITQRPFWLLNSPQPISQRGNQLYWMDALEIVRGPERLEDYWWSQPSSRDYYVAKTRTGQPVWIFQDRHSRCWFLQGIFD